MPIQLRRRTRDEQRRPADGQRRERRYLLERPSTYSFVRDSGVEAFSNAFDRSPCIVRDLSSLGAGIEFEAPEPSVNDRIKVQLQLRDSERASIELTGVVRHARTEEAGIARAGVEFVDVGALERALLHQVVEDLKATS